jgi:hypothetical protein
MALSDFVLETRNIDGGLRIASRGEQAGRVGTHRSRPMTPTGRPPMSSLGTESVIDHAGPVIDYANPR